ncbi:helix-turn-helix domain-containing protein [Fulvivirgaceae bacterium BMA12]|uniref:Helix-turn-helix domain-containing protein n=1 Tax=Agaribacillus aureus TaxID=3051825 RepID=A0ABT8LAV3_9BACT|nr:helix-turn-helix domain-containing protein [Fulvivirgaceae bacterium BMA12]
MNGQEIYFNLNPVNFLIVSGILQIFIVSAVLFFRKDDQLHAGKLLAITLFIVGLHLTNLMLLDLNLDNMYPFLLWLPYSYLTAIGPLIFFYTKSRTENRFKISSKAWIHFVPVIIEWLLQVVQIIFSVKQDVIYYNTPTDFIISPIIYISAAISIFYYLKRSLAVIKNHEIWVLKNFSNVKEVTLAWLYKLIAYYRILWMLWIPVVIIFLLLFRFQLQYLGLVIIIYGLILSITYLTYWIGLEGLRRTNFIYITRRRLPSENKSYTNLSEKEIKSHIAKVKQLMNDEKLYLNEHLNLRDFADKAAADPNLISYILNTHLHKNFYEFVNSYRIEEVKKKMNDPKYAHLKLMAIAYECGFNSKATFNRVFLKMEGVSPTAYKNRQSRL